MEQRRIKIVHIISTLNRGGAETLLLNICKEVKKNEASIEFRIILLQDLSYLADDFNSAGIPFEVLQLKSTNFFHNVSVLTKRLKELKPVAVHSHLLRSDRIALTSAFLAGIKYRYTTIHSMIPSSNRSEAFARLMTTLFATKLIAVSHSARKYSLKKHLYPFRNIAVIYNAPGFKPSHTPTVQKLSGKMKLVNVGRLHIEKGQIHLIRAIRKLADSGISCSLKILGDGEERAHIESEIALLNLTKQVELVGITNDVEKYLNEADFYVASSLSEGFGMAQIEGLMLGLPLIATAIPTHKEILSKDSMKSKINMCNPSDAESLAEAIRSAVILTPEDYHEESLRALRIGDQFSLDKMVDQYSRLYTV